MTKNIEIKEVKEDVAKKTTKKRPYKKGSKEKKPTFMITSPDEIKEALVGFTHIESHLDTRHLIPHMSQIRYINKEDKGMRRWVVFVRTVDNGILVRFGKNYWQLYFTNNIIYAKCNAQEDVEKSRFVNFLESNVQKGALSFKLNNVDATWEELIQLYSDETL